MHNTQCRMDDAQGTETDEDLNCSLESLRWPKNWKNKFNDELIKVIVSDDFGANLHLKQYVGTMN